VGCNDSQLRFWEHDQSVKSRPFKCLPLPISILSIAFDGRKVVIGSTEGRFLKVLPRSNVGVRSSLIRNLPGTTAGIKFVQIKGETVAFAAEGEIYICDLTYPNQMTYIVYGCPSEILHLRFLESQGDDALHSLATAIAEDSRLTIIYIDIKGNLSNLRDSRTFVLPKMYDQCLDIKPSSRGILVIWKCLQLEVQTFGQDMTTSTWVTIQLLLENKYRLHPYTDEDLAGLRRCKTVVVGLKELMACQLL
jgi:hypothetical protein